MLLFASSWQLWNIFHKNLLSEKPCLLAAHLVRPAPPAISGCQVTQRELTTLRVNNVTCLQCILFFQLRSENAPFTEVNSCLDQIQTIYHSHKLPPPKFLQMILCVKKETIKKRLLHCKPIFIFWVFFSKKRVSHGSQCKSLRACVVSSCV